MNILTCVQAGNSTYTIYLGSNQNHYVLFGKIIALSLCSYTVTDYDAQQHRISRKNIKIGDAAGLYDILYEYIPSKNANSVTIEVMGGKVLELYYVEDDLNITI